MTRSDAGSGADTAVKRRLWPHLVLVAVGLAGLVWALWLSASPVIVCRDVEMRPGDVCHNAEGRKGVQTYQERWDAAQQARPVVGVLSVVLVGFGGALSAQAVRRPQA